MRILATGDLHGDVGLAKKLAQKAEDEKVDLVVLCGDLFVSDDKADHIIGEFVKKKKKVFMVPGNHETVATADFLAQMYGITNLHGYSVKYKDIGLFGCGGAEVGPHPIADKDILKLLKQGAEKLEDVKTKIMVTHVHPAGTDMEKLSSFIKGSKATRKAIEDLKPDIVLCSHVHEAKGIEEKIGKTRVINVSKSGTIIDLK